MDILGDGEISVRGLDIKVRQESSSERGSDPCIWIKNLSGWNVTGNRTLTFAMTEGNALSIKLFKPTAATK